MKSFREYITESELSPLTHVMSGSFIDPLFSSGQDTNKRIGYEHAHHAVIPGKNGPTNLWITHLENSDKGEHDLHFSISNDVTPELFHRTRETMDRMGQKYDSPHEVFHAVPGEREWQELLTYHGPTTMIHVMRHMEKILRKIPSGHTINVNAIGGSNKMYKKKINAYRSIAAKGEREGLVRVLPSESSSGFRMVRL